LSIYQTEGNMSERLIVIGSGPGGYTSAVLGADLGMDVTLIEKGEIGGTCTNRGCIPSKALLSVADTVNDIGKSRRKGIKSSLEEIDMKRVQRFKQTAIKTSRKGIAKQLKDAGVTVIEGEASVGADKSVSVGGEKYSADRLIIATGSEPVTLPFLEVDEKNVLTSKGVLELEEIPDSMVIIGGGYIGMEMAEIFSSFGTEVTIVEMMDSLLPGMDSSLSELAENMMKRKRVTYYTGTSVKDVEGTAPSNVVLSNGEELTADKVLCSVGRKPIIPETELDIIDDDGKVITDDHLKTPIEGVYAVGDINGRSMLAHSAYKQAEIAVKHMNGEDVIGFSGYQVPAGVYTHPELASVGLTEEDAKGMYDDYSTAEYPISANGRGYSTGERMGFVKVIVVGDELVGLHMACPGATDIIMEGTTAMQHGISVEKMIDLIHPHPTYSEAFLDALKDI